MEICKNCNGWGMLLNGRPNPFMGGLDRFETNVKYEICRNCLGKGYVPIAGTVEQIER